VRWGATHSRYGSSKYVYASGRNWPAGARIEIQCSDSADGIYADTNANIPVTYCDRFADANGNFDIVDANPGICFSNIAATIRVWAPDGGPDTTTNLPAP